jgi:hypothetical protein
MTRRLKSYSAETGMVYQYVFVGERRAPGRWFRAGTEYLFDVFADRKSRFPVIVFLADAVCRTWERANGRELSWPERYAAAKLRLFLAFDQVEELDKRAPHMDITREHLREFLNHLLAD